MLAINNTAKDNALNIEEKVNQIEGLLIDKINKSQSEDNILTYKLGIKLILMHRGYYTDPAGKLEKQLVDRLFQTVSPQLGAQYKDTMWMDNLSQDVMSASIHAIITLFNQGACQQSIIKKILMLLEEQVALRHDTFTKRYLDLTLSTLKRFRWEKTTIQQSIWASATLEALDYINALVQDASKVKQSRERERINKKIELQVARARLYSQYALEANEPIGLYAQMKLEAVQPIKENVNSESCTSYCIEQENLETLEKQRDQLKKYRQRYLDDELCFLRATQTICKHRKQKHLVSIALTFAKQISDKSLQRFVTLCTKVCLESTNHKKNKERVEELVSLKPSENLRNMTDHLWLALAEHFLDLKNTKSDEPLSCAIRCCEHVINSADETLVVKAKTLLEKASSECGQLRQIQSKETESKMVDQEQVSSENVVTLCSDAPRYAKQSQYLYLTCLINDALEKSRGLAAHVTASPRSKRAVLSPRNGFLAQSLNQITTLSAVYIDLCQDHYPFGLELMLNYLSSDTNSTQCHAAFKTITEQYGEKYTNPLNLCKILRKESHSYNRYYPIWYQLYSNALDNDFMAEEINELKASGLTKKDITYKLETYARSVIYSENTVTPDVLIPRGCELLIDIDTELVGISLELIERIKSDVTFTDYSFALDHSGLLEADFAQMAGRRRNDLLMHHLAKLSISCSTDALASPKTRVQPQTDTVDIAGSTRPRTCHTKTSLGGLHLKLEQLKEQKNSPSYLGYFLLAVAEYNLHIKNNEQKNPDDVASFIKLIETSLKTPRESERQYIKALILLNYINSDLDKSWLVQSEFSTLIIESKRYLSGKEFRLHLTTPPGQSLASNSQEQYVYFLFHRIKEYLDDALSSEDMYPLAIWPYADELKVYELMHADSNYERKNSFVQKLVSKLEEAIKQHGYTQALYLYAQVVLEHLDLFSCSGSLSEILEHIQHYLNKSERYIYIVRGQKKDLEDAVQAQKKIEQFGQLLNNADDNNKVSTFVLDAIKDNNTLSKLRAVSKTFNKIALKILAKRVAHFPVEKPIPACSNSILISLTCQFTYRKSAFQLSPSACFKGIQIQSSSDRGRDKLSNLETYFLLAKVYYEHRNDKTIHSPDKTIVRDGDSLIILHADIAILGIIKLCQKHAEIESLIELLTKVEEKTEDFTWGSNTTPIKVSETILRLKVKHTSDSIDKSPPSKSRSHSMLFSRSPSENSPREPRRSGSYTSRSSGRISHTRTSVSESGSGSSTDIRALLSPPGNRSRSNSTRISSTSPRSSRSGSRVNSMRVGSKKSRKSVIPTSDNNSTSNTPLPGFDLLRKEDIPSSKPGSPILKRKTHSVPASVEQNPSKPNGAQMLNEKSESLNALDTKPRASFQSPRLPSSSEEDIEESSSYSSDGSNTP